MRAEPAGRHRSGGLTLIELMIALAITAVLMSLAMPSFAHYLQRHRLKAAAQGLDLDLRDARYEAVRRGEPLYLTFHAGTDWCYAIATRPDCDCRQAQPCRMKAARAVDLPGVQLAQALATRFDPGSGLSEVDGAGAVWQLLSGERVRVSLTPLGRPAACMIDGQLSPFPAC